MDLRNSAVHVARARGGGNHRLRWRSPEEQVFRCKRCLRDLPEGQFLPTGRSGDLSVIYLHPLCNKCRDQRRSAFVEHELYDPALHRFITTLCGRAKSGAPNRKIVWALTDEDVLGMYLRQEGRCALSGAPMTFRKSTKPGKDWTAISIDRVNSERNYTLDNVHLVCAVVNIMKMEMPLNEFVTWCARITAKVVCEEKQEAIID